MKQEKNDNRCWKLHASGEREHIIACEGKRYRVIVLSRHEALKGAT